MGANDPRGVVSLGADHARGLIGRINVGGPLHIATY